ncbi:MAG: glycosyltransferase [Gammaproteobacteria bacterium]
MSLARPPKLVLFRSSSDGLPAFIRLHLAQQQACLEQFFDVVLIEKDCDYAQVCDEHEPDMALFESGVYATRPRRITSTNSHPQVLKAGFINSDAYCLTRSSFVSDMERWGVGTYFGIAVSLGEYFPAIADQLFTWPNFVDPELYRDYGETKLIPVCSTGSAARHYPWRNRINKVLSQCYPSLAMPHFGWFSAANSTRMVFGEKYARLLNASVFAPTCGTIAREVVRKHFEIPACRTCLLTEKAASIEAAGFEDGVNCLFVDDKDVAEKVEYLLTHPDDLRRITDAGHELVHSRHTARQRSQIYDWYRLKRAVGPDQRVIQPGPFEPLRLAESGSRAHQHAISSGPERTLLREGYRHLTAQQYAEAERCFIRCLNYHFIPEPLLGLARCRLASGRPREALTDLARLIHRELGFHHAIDPDPVEWAWYLMTLLCCGEKAAALARADRFTTARHIELAYASTVLALLDDNRNGKLALPVSSPSDRVSVHQLPQRSFDDWLDELLHMLAACGQRGLAARLSAARSDVTPNGTRLPSERTASTDGWRVEKAERIPASSQLRAKLHELRNGAIRRVRRLSGKVGFQKTDAELLNDMEALASEEAIEGAVLIAPTRQSRLLDALATNLQRNTSCPKILRIDCSTLPRPAPGAVTLDAATLRGLLRAAGIGAPSLFCIDNGEADVVVEDDALRDAKIIVLTGVQRARTSRLLASLLADPQVLPSSLEPSLWNGCAVLRRMPFEPARDNPLPAARRRAAVAEERTS